MSNCPSVGQLAAQLRAFWCAQAIINALQVLKVLGRVLHAAVLPALEELLPAVGGSARPGPSPVRAAAVSAAAALADAHPSLVLPHLLRCGEALHAICAGSTRLMLGCAKPLQSADGHMLLATCALNVAGS
jgi:hypothetical protein